MAVYPLTGETLQSSWENDASVVHTVHTVRVHQVRAFLTLRVRVKVCSWAYRLQVADIQWPPLGMRS